MNKSIAEALQEAAKELVDASYKEEARIWKRANESQGEVFDEVSRRECSHNGDAGVGFRR